MKYRPYIDEVGISDNFGGEIAQVLIDAKYDRSSSGTIDGWGITWLP